MAASHHSMLKNNITINQDLAKYIQYEGALAEVLAEWRLNVLALYYDNEIPFLPVDEKNGEGSLCHHLPLAT